MLTRRSPQTSGGYFEGVEHPVAASMRWWVKKSQALLITSFVTSALPLLIVPLASGSTLYDAFLLYFIAGGMSTVFIGGFISLGYFHLALVWGLARRPAQIMSEFVALDVALLSLVPSALVLAFLFSVA